MSIFMAFPSFICALKLDQNITTYLRSIPLLSQNMERERFSYKFIDKLGYRKVEKSQYSLEIEYEREPICVASSRMKEF